MKLFAKFCFLITACLLLCGLGCKKNPGDTSLLVINIHSVINGDSIVFGTTYPNAKGRNISFNRINYYITDIQLIRTDGSLQPVSGTIYVLPNTGQYILGSVPTGTYKSIEFNVGVDPSVNHIDPTNYVGGNALAAQTPSMHFSSDSLGYIFMAVEGMVDSSAAGTGSPNTPFAYHIGTDSLFKTVTLPDHSAAPYNAVFNANGTKVLTIQLLADFGALMQNVDMRSNTLTNTYDYPVLADSLAANIPNMFRYQQ